MVITSGHEGERADLFCPDAMFDGEPGESCDTPQTAVSYRVGFLPYRDGGPRPDTGNQTCTSGSQSGERAWIGGLAVPRAPSVGHFTVGSKLKMCRCRVEVALDRTARRVGKIEMWPAGGKQVQPAWSVISE